MAIYTNMYEDEDECNGRQYQADYHQSSMYLQTISQSVNQSINQAFVACHLTQRPGDWYKS